MTEEKIYRANWTLAGLRGQTLKPGDTIALTEAEAAPYLGGVLSAVEPAAAADPPKQPTQPPAPSAPLTDADFEKFTKAQLAEKYPQLDFAGKNKAEMIEMIKAFEAGDGDVPPKAKVAS